MAYSAWSFSAIYSVGDIVRATSMQASGLVFRCVVAGTSELNEPAWPTDIGGTVIDGGVTWQAISSIYEELSVLAPSAIIELFELKLDATLHGASTTYRWHNGVNANVTGNITWNGNDYVRLPIEAEGFDYTNTGSLPRPTLTVSNLSNVITTLLLLVNTTTPGNDLGGARVKRIRTLKKYLDGEPAADPNAKFPDEIWYIDRKANETRDAVSFELASKLDLAGVMLPQRQIIANICQWQYRSSECGYTGTQYFDANDKPTTNSALDQCGKRLSSCKLRFESFTRQGSVTVSSNQLSVTSPMPATNLTGLQIKGHGVASGTTISSVSSDLKTITMSAAATASTTASYTGTIQSNRTQIILSSTTGLTAGMSVSGSFIAAGTTISSISGSTITLSQQAIANYTLATTKQCQWEGRGVVRLVVTGGTSGLSVGMAVLGLGLPADYSAKITEVSTAGYIKLSYNIPSFAGFQNFSFYTLSSYSSSTYTFAGSTLYSFNDATNSTLPFGSFPGAGLK